MMKQNGGFLCGTQVCGMVYVIKYEVRMGGAEQDHPGRMHGHLSLIQITCPMSSFKGIV